MRPRENIVGFASFHRASRYLSIASALLLGAMGTLAFAADQNVINTLDSGAGSLRQAVADVGTGENVSFQPAVAGGTINLTSGTLDVTRSMNFNNDSGGVVTINGTEDYYTRVTDTSATTSFHSGLTFQSTTSVTGEGVAALVVDASHTINGLASTMTASSLSDGGGGAYAVCAYSGLSIVGDGLSGAISASSRHYAATGEAKSVGILVAGGCDIAGGITGTITSELLADSATVSQLDCRGIQTFGNLEIVGGITGNITASLQDVQTSAYRVCEGVDVGGSLSITDGISGNIEVNSTGRAIGIDADTISLTGGISGNISAISVNRARTGVGLHLGGSDTVANHIDEVSGTITADGSDAWGIDSRGGLNGGDADTPLVVSGTIHTEADQEAVAIWGMTGPMNVKLEQTGTLYAVGGQASYAVRGTFGVPADDKVELVAGCTVVGDIYLGSADDHDTLTLSGTTGATTCAGNIRGTAASDLDIGVTGGNWNLNGVISGAAALDVSGGSTTLSGLNTYTRGTTVDGGTLIVNGQIVGNLNINGGLVGGTGQVYNVVNSGTLAPGNSIGTMTVAGAYDQMAGSTLEIEVNDTGQSDLLNVTGAATIYGGTVDVQAEPGVYTAGTTYTFLTANSVTGEFDAITEDVLGFDTILVYNPQSIQFYLSSHYLSQARTYNQLAVAGYLNDHVGTATGDFRTVLLELDTLYGDSARAAMDSMSGELYPSLSTVGIESTDRFLRTLAERLRARRLGLACRCAPVAGDGCCDDCSETACEQDSCDCPERRPNCWKPWAEGYGVGASIAGNGNASGLGYSTGGLTFGIEDDLTDNTLLGVVGGYANTYVAIDERVDRATIDSGQVGVYLNHAGDLGYATAIAAFDASSYDTRRQVAVGQIARTANAGYSGNDFSFYLEAGRFHRVRALHLQPYAALQYIQLHQNDFIEWGAQSVDLSVGGVHADSFRGLLGTRLVSFMQTKGDRLLSLEGRALWRHEFLDEARVLDATFAGQPGPAFVVNGVNVDRDAAILGGGLAIYLAENAKLFADYDLLVSENYTAHAGSGGIMLLW